MVGGRPVANRSEAASSWHPQQLLGALDGSTRKVEHTATSPRQALDYCGGVTVIAGRHDDDIRGATAVRANRDAVQLVIGRGPAWAAFNGDPLNRHPVAEHRRDTPDPGPTPTADPRSLQRAAVGASLIDDAPSPAAGDRLPPGQGVNRRYLPQARSKSPPLRQAVQPHDRHADSSGHQGNDHHQLDQGESAPSRRPTPTSGQAQAGKTWAGAHFSTPARSQETMSALAPMPASAPSAP